MGLEQDIRAWDGKSAAVIGAIYAEHAGGRGLVSRLIDLAAKPDLERGATWLLKKAVESGAGPLTGDQADRLYGVAGGLSDWGARLHVLQCMPRMAVPARRAAAVAGLLDECLEDRRAIVRAWAYTGYHELAKASPEFRDRADELLSYAAENESAGSIRVRVRRAIEELRE